MENISEEKYQKTLDFLFSQLPYFTRDGKAAIKANLNNTINLCRFLNNPHEKFKTIHVAGTNGKGSVCNTLSSILQENGLKVGLYTSPHLFDFRERIKINGKMIDKEFVVDFVEKVNPILKEIKPSFFELTVGMAFDFFERENVDIAIIETGLGGRLDSTNIINPVLSVITNIGFDHMDLLGDTLEKIAFEKAGIIKANTPVVIGENRLETKEVFKIKAKECNSKIYFTDEAENKLSLNEFELKGNYQIQNLKTIETTVKVLNSLNFTISDESLLNGLKNVKRNTGFFGRWEILKHNPKVIADTGHNEDGMKEILNQILTEKYDKLHIVLGMMRDKDRGKILKLLPQNAVYYFCSPDLPRAIEAETLKNEAKEFKLIGENYQTVKIAINQALSIAGKNDLIFIGGSTFVVAEIDIKQFE